MNNPSVAVITSSVGRPHLLNAIKSVQAQTYPCKHYVFVDGEQFHQAAESILRHFPDVVTTYLPMNTGANGWVNSSINAIAPFLVKEDVICYLDDDNWYEPNHIAELISAFSDGVDYAYSLRKFFNLNRQFICNDDVYSLGEWNGQLNFPLTRTFQLQNREALTVSLSSLDQRHHIDTNCYAFPRQLAMYLALDWDTGVENDRNVFNRLQSLHLKGKCSGKYTVNYVIDISKTFPDFSAELHQQFNAEIAQQALDEWLRIICAENIRIYGGTPWAKSY